MLLQQCHPNSAGSLVISRRTSEILIVFVVSFVLSATPQTGGSGQGIYIYFKNTKNLFIHIARVPIGDSPRVHPNILKISPPFASSEGVSASGVRYQSDGV